MNKVVLFSGCAAAILLAGCRPELAKGAYGAEEEQWNRIISSSYSGYRPPRTAPPAIEDKATPEALEKQRERQELMKADSAGRENAAVQEESPVTEADPAAAVDKAAVKAEPLPPKDEKKDAAPEKKDADKKAADKKAGEETGSGDFTVYVVKAGDTPGSIARKFYGKASFYEVIMKANPQIKNAKQIQIGTKIKVPKL